LTARSETLHAQLFTPRPPNPNPPPQRWWLLRGVTGDVLEISAGTGRNLPHYPWPQIRSLTLADVSAPMLRVAEDKYFGDLAVPVKHGGHRARFVLADAERMVDEGAGAGAGVVREVRPGRERREGGHDHIQRQDGQQREEEKEKEEGTQKGGGSPDGRQPSALRSIWRKPKGRQPAGAAGGPAAAAATADEATAGSSSDTGSSSSGGRQKTASTPSPPPQASSSRSSQASSQAAAAEGPLSTFAPASFDAVVDTFGLCSCSDPVKVRPSSDHPQIILRSSSDHPEIFMRSS
jgi:hypothetical protein